MDFWPHNNNLPFVPQGFEKLPRSSPLRLIARDIGKKLFYRVLGNVTQKKKSPYGDLCNITITFGRPDWTMEMEGIDNELDDILSGDIRDFSVLSIFIAIFML